ncbi:MAG: hypothetical protein QUS14_03215 [Pyrinomonadaceae bacterium]|nr:hypothetical protein [Pyrinomonadaceae bacterium]
MANNQEMTSEEMKIQAIIGGFLATNKGNMSRESAGPHLDEDSFAAFTEGRLSEREAKPMISHLVDCSFCRNVTVELVRLDAAFAVDEIEVPASSAEPARISDVLAGLFSKIFGSSDGAVFAHHEADEKEREDNEEEKTKDQ